MTIRIDPELGARVHLSSAIDHRHRRTGEWEITWGKDFAVDGIAFVAVCTLPNEPGFNLLCLNADGHVIFDSAHETLEEARTYAEREYQGLSATWQRAP